MFRRTEIYIIFIFMKRNLYFYLITTIIIVIFFWALYLRLNGKIDKKPYPKLTVPELFSYSNKNTTHYETTKEFVFDIILPHKFSGIIWGKGIEEMNHDSHLLLILTKKYYFNLYTNSDLYPDSGLFDFSIIGDSIFKNSNSLIISVKRGNVIRNFNVTPYNEFWKNPYYSEKD